MNEHNMEYNSSREDLIIPEYGRHIQNLVEHAKTIEGAELRQEFAHRIIGLMMQMHPQNRGMDDYREKMWKHLFRIAKYELEVQVPEGIHPSPEDARKRPEKVPYPDIDTKFKHYGNNVQKLINKALTMDEGPVRSGFVAVIGSYMKLAYRTWNKEHYVSDEVIKTDLLRLSGGKLQLDEEISLDNLGANNRRRKRPMNSNGGNERSGGRDRDRDRDNDRNSHKPRVRIPPSRRRRN